jgi:curved DNA-binding protein CbpA
MNDFKNYYRVLRIGSTADDSAIKAAFRRLALRHHPDRARDTRAADRFREIRDAYEVLSDPERRERYDAVYHARRAAVRRGFAVQRREILAPRRAGFGLTLDVLGVRVNLDLNTEPRTTSGRRRRRRKRSER